MIGMTVIREVSFPHILTVLPHSLTQNVMQVDIPLHKFRQIAVIKSDKIVKYKYLNVTIRPGPNSNCRDI